MTPRLVNLDVPGLSIKPMIWTTELDSAFRIAWNYPNPPFIQRWGEFQSEERELYDAFDERAWDEVRCDQLPSWFMPYGFLDDGQWNYYVASYARCSLLEERDEHQARTIDIVYAYLGQQLKMSESTLSPLKAAALAMYIEETRDFASSHYWIESVVKHWPNLVFQICHRHTEYL